ncbi:MAG: hypothetical protein L7G90_00370 [Candidatus Nanopusillus sp.]|nr:hypothetical protein [Candidatus Nanopusillus sp.]
MKKNQLNLLSIAIILLVVSLSFLIYYQYSLNIKKEQEEYIFENFINSLQNLQNTINSIQGTYYIKVNIPNGVLLYANGTELIIQYDNNNYTINFYKNVTLYNNQNVSFLYPNNYIYLVSTNNTVFITTNFQNSITILNEYLPSGTLVYITPENNQNSPNNNQNSQCLFTYNGQTSFFWGDVNGNDYLPPIGDQGECGDCWAFASSNGIASIYMIRNNEPNEGLQLSPAYLAIECNNGYPNTPSYCDNNFGCNGGLPYFGILFTSQYGIPPDPGWKYYDSTLSNCQENNYQSYPDNVCKFNYNGPSSPLYYSQGVIDLTQNGPLTDQQIIQDLLCYGPLVTAGFLAGSGGSNPNIDPQQIAPDSAHAMLLVGYTTGNTIYSQLCQEVYGTQDCWIFENEWGDITGCIVFTTNGVPEPEPGDPNLCGELYQNYQKCTATYNIPCGGVYWMQNGYLLVPFGQSPYGLTFPYYIIAIQNVTLSQ